MLLPARSLAASLSAFSAAQGIALAAGLLLHMVAARGLQPADYGRLAVAHSIFLVLLVLLIHAIPTALRRRVSLDAGQLGSAWRGVLWLQLPLAVTIALLLAGCGPLVAAALGDPLLAAPLRLIAVDVALRAGVVEPAWLLLNATGRHRLQAGLMGGHSVLRCCLGVGAVIAGQGLWGAIGGLVAASVLSAVIVAAVLGRCQVAEPAAGRLAACRDLLPWLQWAPAANVVNHLALAGNLWLVKALSTDPAAVGPYAACYMLASTLLPTSAILSSSCFPRFAALVEAGAGASAAGVLRAVLRMAAVAGVLSAVVVATCGGAILQVVFGERYAGAAQLLLLLWLGIGITAAYWFFCEMLAAAACLRGRLGIALVTSGATGWLTIVLFQRWGPAGAAGGLAISAVLGLVLSGILLARIAGSFLPWCTLGRTTGAAAAAAAAGAWIGQQAPELVTGIVCVQAGAYCAGLWLLGEYSAFAGRAAPAAGAEPEGSSAAG